jgi:hypothetical protein
MQPMSSDHEPAAGPPFKAFLTTRANGGPRTPLVGERLVVQLGRDASGRSLEVSLYLQPWPGRPDELVVAAIDEESQLTEPREYWPRLVVRPSQGPNLILLAVGYDHIPLASQQGSEGENRA